MKNNIMGGTGEARRACPWYISIKEKEGTDFGPTTALPP